MVSSREDGDKVKNIILEFGWVEYFRQKIAVLQLESYTRGQNLFGLFNVLFLSRLKYLHLSDSRARIKFNSVVNVN